MTSVRQSRLNMILEFVYAQGGAGVTRLEVSKRLGLVKGPHVIDMLNQCVSDGFLRVVPDYSRYPVRFMYYPAS